jgi:predicted alpha/beta-fold hydrolase
MPDGFENSAPIPFRSPAWLPGGHAQTIYPYFLARPTVEYRRERIATPDGDFWDFDWLAERPGVVADTPLVVLFHGLEGGAQSHYALMLMALLAARGWRGVIPHFRGCGGEPNLLPRAYHSGDHEDVGAMLTALRERVGPRTPIYAVGVSLGGSALLNWIGRVGTNAHKTLVAAATVSAPLDLMAAGIAIGQGLNRIYTRYFLSTLKPKGLDMARRFPGLLDPNSIARARTMWDFDDAVTAPLHGFAGANDYWTRASSKGWLAEVKLPTLVLNARNDPFVPRISLPGATQVSTAVHLEQPDTGGHVGFMTGPAPGRLDWLPQRLLAYFVRGQ